MKYSVARDYSDLTGMRYCTISEHSGEDFYHKFLNEKFVTAYLQKEQLELNIDGTRDGIGPSFLDESLGNLVYDFTLDVVKKILKVVAFQESHWLEMIKEDIYPTWEERRKRGHQASVTCRHPAWFRLVDGNVVKKVWINPNNEVI